MVTGPWCQRLKVLSFSFKQVTIVTSMSAHEPTLADKITERVVLWFLRWLSKITQEAAKRAKTQSQGLLEPWSTFLAGSCPSLHEHQGAPCTRYNRSLGHRASRRMLLALGVRGAVQERGTYSKQPPSFLAPRCRLVSAGPPAPQGGHSCSVLLRWLCGEALASCPPGGQGTAGFLFTEA